MRRGARPRRASAVATAALPLLLLAAQTALPADTLSAQAPSGESDRIVLRAAEELERGYLFADVGRRVGARLRATVRAGRYRQGPAGDSLARRLTRELAAMTGDGHLTVEYSAAPLPREDSAATAEMTRRDNDRWYGPSVNYGFQRVELLPGNVGYLDLRVFAPVEWAAPSATAAMTLLANADALVIDLRKNGGGHGEMVAWLASYLFDGPRPLSGTYERPSDSTRQRWTLAWVPGPRFGGTRPVYLLTSRRTFSAAEAFAYDLQVLGRATVVGEATGGGAHPYENVRLDAHYTLGLPTARSVNPITGGNWQGTGVRPDMAVPADSALEVALRLARSRARER